MSHHFEVGKIVIKSLINDDGQKESSYDIHGEMANWEIIALLEQLKLQIWLDSMVAGAEEDEE